MSDEKYVSLLQEQKKNKPKIEDVIPDYLDGEMKKAALDFARHMQENKMPLRWAGFTNAWKAACKSQCICYVRLRGNSDVPSDGNSGGRLWVVTPYLDHMHEYEGTVLREGVQNIIGNNVFHCQRCFPEKYPEGRPCVPGRNMTLLGKEVNGICRFRRPVWVWDPGKAAIDGVKKLLELEQKARTEEHLAKNESNTRRNICTTRR